MYEATKARGIPVDSMDWETFLSYIRIRASDLLSPYINTLSSAISSHVARVASLLFDGEYLHWQELGHSGYSTSWVAYSGRKEYLRNKDYSIKAQAHKFRGPIPEGFYIASQAEYQERPEEIWSWVKHSVGKGAWPGGNRSWGKSRIWLEPENGTETYGRSGFSIHGGTDPGSAGCIDLVESMNDFASRFRQYGRSLRLYVDYTKFK